MKDWKKRIGKEKKEIADADREFLEQTLYPIVDRNVKEKPPRKPWYALSVTAVCLAVMLHRGSIA